MTTGKIESIHVVPEASAPMRSVREVRAVPGRGLEGDRYFVAGGTSSSPADPSREVTLVEREAIEAARRDYGVDLEPGSARRNLVTSGVPLNHLVGREFTVGEATLRGIRLCEPCRHLRKLTGADVISSLKHRGGLRAQVVSGGLIRAGDPVVWR